MGNINLSVSKVKTFLSCKKKYKYQYIDKLPRKDQDFFTFGSFCHNVLELFHNEYIKGCDLPYNITLSKSYKESYIKYKDKMTEDMKKECWELFNNYLKLISNLKKTNSSPNIISCEKKFNLDIKYNNKNINLIGAIDRIDIDDDNIINVCDYKIIKNKSFLKNDDFQLLTYAYALLQESPLIEKIRASYILLRHNFEKFSFVFTKDKILKVKDKYIDYATKIESESEYEPTVNKLCAYCDYIDICKDGKNYINPSMNFGKIEW